MCEKSLALCLARSTSKNQQRYLLELLFFYFYLYHNLLKVYLCYLVLTYPHNNKRIVVLLQFDFTIYWFHFEEYNWRPKIMCDYLFSAIFHKTLFVNISLTMTAHTASL